MTILQLLLFAPATASVRGGCVVVTGASRGIGAGIAKAFASEGAASVCLVARSEAALQNTCSVLRSAHPSVSFHPILADVTRSGDRDRIVQTVEAIGGQQLLLINNAGVEAWGPYEHATEATGPSALASTRRGGTLG